MRPPNPPSAGIVKPCWTKPMEVAEPQKAHHSPFAKPNQVMAMNDNEITTIIIKKHFLISILNLHFEPADLTALQTCSALICFSQHLFFFSLGFWRIYLQKVMETLKCLFVIQYDSFQGGFLMFVLISQSVTKFIEPLSSFLYVHCLQEFLKVKTVSLIFKPKKCKRAGFKDSNTPSFQ